MPNRTESAAAPTAKPEKWFSIRAAAQPDLPTEIYIYGTIGDSWYEDSVTAADFVKALAEITSENITIRINSIGGSVPDGLAIYNAIKRHPSTITTAIDGMAMSIASLIAMAGDTVEMAENSLFMVHAPWTYAGGNSNDLREYADQLDKWSAAMSSSYVAKTGKTSEEIMALLTDGVDHYYTAQEALSEGFIDNIVSAASASAISSMAVMAAARFPAAADRLSRLILNQPNQQPPLLPAKAEGSPAAIAAQSKEHTMPQANPAGTQTPANETNREAIAAATAAGIKAEAERRQSIDTAFTSFASREGVSALMRECQNDTNCDVQAANNKLLALIAKDQEPLAAGAGARVSDRSAHFIADAANSILARAGIRDKDNKVIAVAGSNDFKAVKLLDIARACLAKAGISTTGLGQMQIVAAAFTQTSSDFGVLLENAMHKTLQAAYATAPDTWTHFCAVGSVSDFRAHNRYRLGSLGNLSDLDEAGEFKTKTIPDGEKASVSIDTKGNLINITRQAIINDDLGAFIGLAAMLGRSAKRTIEALVYSLLAENSGMGPLLADGKSLFHADHNNIGTTGALAVSVIEGGRVILASQLDISGNDFLSLTPAVWLGPSSLGGTARVINQAEYDPDTANKMQRPNMVRGLFGDIVDTPRLSGTAFYQFASPLDAPVIEVDFLDGNQEPFLEQQQGFTVDGTQFKVRLDVGATAVDYRGAVRHAGA